MTSLSIKKCAAVTAEGAKAFANLVNLVNLDLERCPKIHGGLVHLKGIPFFLSSSERQLMFVTKTMLFECEKRLSLHVPSH